MGGLILFGIFALMLGTVLFYFIGFHTFYEMDKRMSDEDKWRR